MSAVIRYPLRVVALAVLLLGTGSASPALAQQRVGVNSAVNPEATGIPPGASPRRLVLGQDVVFNERITTEGSGQTQILFVDESSMTIGPNSDMVIDEFVYDPASGTGKLAANLTRGVFRFVGGKLSKQDNAVALRTPAATIGIRGGCVLAKQLPDGHLDLIFVCGKEATVTGTDGTRQTLTRPGFEVTVDRPGAAPSSPFPAPPGAAGTLLAQLDGRPGAKGGATTVPTDAMVASSGIANVVSGNVSASVQAANQIQPAAAQPAKVSTAVQQSQSNVQNVAYQGATVTPVGGGSAVSLSNLLENPSSSGTATTPIAPAASGIPVAGGFSSTNGAGTALGFTSPGVAYANGTLANGMLSATIPNLGPLQIPLAPGSTTFGSSGTASPLGPVSGTSFLSADQTFFYADLTPVNQPGEREFVYGGQAVNASFYQPTGSPRFFAFAIQPDAALQSTVPFIRQQAGGLLSNPVVSPLYLAVPANTAFANTGPALTKSLQASLAINGQGAQQTSVLVVAVGNAFSTVGSNSQPVLNGQIRGSFRADGSGAPVAINSSLLTPSDGNGNSFYGGNTISGFALNQNSSNGSTAVPRLATETNFPGLQTTSYGFTQPGIATPLPAGVGTSQTTQTLTGFFGGTMQPFTGGTSGTSYVLAGSTSVSTDAANLQVAATFAGQDPITASTSGVNSASLQFGTLSPGATRARQGYVDDSLFAALESPTTASQINGTPLVINGDPTQASQIFMVTSSAVPSTALLPPGVSFCQCQYLQWGYWGGVLDTPNAAGTGASRVDVGHINTWVAGQPTSPVTLPVAGVGTFSGAAVGSVYNNGANYLAAGGFTNTYNFATQTGTVAISNYDGRNFSGNVRAGANGLTYSGPLSGSGLAGSANGMFFGPGAAETGGNFAAASVSGPTYLTSGIFAGKR